jgi:hypothetical protein
MAVPETEARARVKSVVEAAIPAVTVENDRLPRAAGRDGLRVAVSPIRAAEEPRQVGTLVVPILLQFYLAYEDRPDEEISRDPAEIEEIADTLRRAFQQNSSGNTADMWYLRWKFCDYPPDPTGNITRLEAEIEARSNNPAGLYETV